MNDSVLPPVAMPTSQPLLLKIVWWTFGAAIALAVVGGIVGYLFAGVPGLLGAVVGAVIGGVCMAMSAGSMAFANRFIASESYVAIFFGSVLGSLVLKMVFFLVAAFFLRDATWLSSNIMFITIIVGILLSLTVDLIFVVKSRVGAVSDARLHE